MNILQIFDQTSPLVSGYSMRSRYITDSLAKLGVKVRVISSPIYAYKQDKEIIDEVTYTRTILSHWEWIRLFPILKEILTIEALKKNIEAHWDSEIKVIDAHSSVLNGIAGYSMAKKYNVPFIYEIRAFWEDAAVDQGKTVEGGWRYNLTKKIETDIIHKANHVTVICEGLKNDLLKRGIKEEKITVIPNGVDTQSFQPLAPDQDIIKQYGLANHKVIGFIGTFFLFEGLDLLVKAVKQILTKKSDVKFLIVGGGRQEEELKQMVKEMGLRKRVIFTGRVKHDDIKRYYSVIDIFVYPRISKRITELVTPLKPLEALAMEKIVIASNVGGLRELIKDGFNGLLFKAGDTRDLAEKCVYALNHSTQMQKMVKQARDYVIEHRNWPMICRRYLKIYDKLGVGL